jgi:hypothetical protein
VGRGSWLVFWQDATLLVTRVGLSSQVKSVDNIRLIAMKIPRRLFRDVFKGEVKWRCTLVLEQYLAYGGTDRTKGFVRVTVRRVEGEIPRYVDSRSHVEPERSSRINII